MSNYEPMSSTEAAEELGVSARRVLYLIQSGRLRAKKMPGLTGAYLLDPADVERYRKQRDEQARASA